MKNEKKLRILVVDDSKLISTMLADELRASNYDVNVAGSAEEADKILDTSDFDILFLDIKLPGISGLEYLGKIREKKKNIIVIVMTGYESTSTAVEAIEKGAYDYIIKPVKTSHIELIIRRALKRYEIEQERNITVEALTDYIKNAEETDLRIAELKNEVNSLLAELHKSRKYKTNME